jgi:SAM-dependent methyltransferase
MKPDLLGSKHTLFRLFYRLGFTPWDGHPLAHSLRNLVEGNNTSPALPAAAALELGCGTGDTSIYLARQGWQVTAVDFVPTALEKARAKPGAENVNFVHADVRHLRQAGISGPVQLIVDNGCLHNMNDDDRDAYVREVTAVAAPDARLLIIAFLPGGRFGVRGIDREEMERRFTVDWTMVSAGPEQELDAEKTPTHYYLFHRDA